MIQYGMLDSLREEVSIKGHPHALLTSYQSPEILYGPGLTTIWSMNLLTI
jgi:hypothetical protein